MLFNLLHCCVLGPCARILRIDALLTVWVSKLMRFASLSVKGQDTCNITCKKVTAPSLKGNFLIIHHICALVPLTDGPIFSSAVTFICNKLGRRTEKRSLCWQKRTGQPANEESSSIGKALDCRGHCLDVALFKGNHLESTTLMIWGVCLLSKEEYISSCILKTPWVNLWECL